jgi:hypothetical protein
MLERVEIVIKIFIYFIVKSHDDDSSEICGTGILIL